MMKGQQTCPSRIELWYLDSVDLWVSTTGWKQKDEDEQLSSA